MKTTQNKMIKALHSIGMLALCCISSLAAAESFGIEFDAWSRDGDAALSFAVRNQSGGTLRNVEIAAFPAGSLNCTNNAAVPAVQLPLDQMADHERIDCHWRPDTAAQSTVFISALDEQDRALTQRFSLVAPRGAITVDQGILVLISSGVHGDPNFNGLLEAGEVIDYNYRLINMGTLTLDNLAVTDLDGAVACPATVLTVGASFVCDRSYVITAADETAGRVENEVEALADDSNGLPVQSSDLIIRLNQASRAGMAVIKSPFLLNDADNSGFASLGDRIRYDFIVRNTNAETLTEVGLIEPDPTLIDTPIVCDSQTLDGNAFGSIGSGVLQAGDVVLCSAEYEIRQSDVDAGQALNLVEALAETPLGLTVQATGASALVIPGAGQLSVEKTTTTPVVVQGSIVEFEITVSNVGNVTLFNVVIDDPIPQGLASFNWTCTGTLCPNPSGTGAINETIPAFPVGGTVVYNIQAQTDPVITGDVVNLVSVLPPGVAVCEPGMSLPPCRDEVPVLVLELVNVPTLGQLGLVILALLVVLVGLRASAMTSRPV